MNTMANRLRFWIHGFALLALLLRGAIPAGFMPAPGLLRMEICTASGLAQVLVGADGKISPHGAGGAHPPCPYAPVLTQSFTGYAALPLFAAVAGMAAFHFPGFLPPRIPAKPWFSQGPPLS